MGRSGGGANLNSMSLLQSPKPDSGPRSLIDELLGEQRSLTAVERFSRAHLEAMPSQQKHYRDLIPLSVPAPGEQYAFEVDLDKCSGCKACVTACHALNGLDNEETWREVGLLHSDDWRAPFQAHVTTACHHCVDPGCLSGCPVLAYDKDPVTGIVRHLDDQCIGCQYCIMKCPYDVPKYSAERGIVRKCDMCSNRLSQGEAPACVQACPSEAIRITVVSQHEVTAQFRKPDEARDAIEMPEKNSFLPASPEPRHTVPTTRYKSAVPLPARILAGDHSQIAPADPHLPLVFMLVLSQLAAGLSLAAIFCEPARWMAAAAAGCGLIGLGCGVMHLGQPLKAWRAFLGWRASWFSREVIAFSGFVPLAALSAVAHWVPPLAMFNSTLAWLTAVMGFVTVACSAMIYADTHREFWKASQSFGKFFGTVLLLGSVAALLEAVVMPGADVGRVRILGFLVGAITAIKLGVEHRIFGHLADEETEATTPLSKTALLLTGDLGEIARIRVACGILGGWLLPLLVAMCGSGTTPAASFAMAMFGLCMLGELMERYLFFRAVVPQKMPGGVAA